MSNARQQCAKSLLKDNSQVLKKLNVHVNVPSSNWRQWPCHNWLFTGFAISLVWSPFWIVMLTVIR